MSSHRFRKVCMNMPCGRTLVAILTSHHPYFGVPVQSVPTWEMCHGPSKWWFSKSSPQVWQCYACPCYRYQSVNSNDNASMSHNWGPSSRQFSLGTGHCQHFCHGIFRILNFETHKRKISHSCVEVLELRLDMFGSSTLEKLVNKILQLTLGSFLDDVSSPAMSWVWPGCWQSWHMKVERLKSPILKMLNISSWWVTGILDGTKHPKYEESWCISWKPPPTTGSFRRMSRQS